MMQKPNAIHFCGRVEKFRGRVSSNVRFEIKLHLQLHLMFEMNFSPRGRVITSPPRTDVRSENNELGTEVTPKTGVGDPT